MVIAKLGKKEMRAPVMITRAMRHTLKLEWKDVPDGMISIPGGPFFAPGPTRVVKMELRTLPDFAIGEFPVTMRQYAEFLDDLSPEEQKHRVPHVRGEIRPWLEKREGRWCVTEVVVEGEDAAKRSSHPDASSILPVMDIAWFDAVAYTEWLSTRPGHAYRLPSSRSNGTRRRVAPMVDPFPMAMRFDPSLAKLSESREEPVSPRRSERSHRHVALRRARSYGRIQDWTSTMAAGGMPPSPEDHRRALATGHRTRWRVDDRAPRSEPLHRACTYRLIDRAGWFGFRLAMDVGGEPTSLTVTPMSR